MLSDLNISKYVQNHLEGCTEKIGICGWSDLREHVMYNLHKHISFLISLLILKSEFLITSLNYVQ